MMFFVVIKEIRKSTCGARLQHQRSPLREILAQTIRSAIITPLTPKRWFYVIEGRRVPVYLAQAIR